MSYTFRSILPSIRYAVLFYLFDPGVMILVFTDEEIEAQRSRTLSGSQASKMGPRLELSVPFNASPLSSGFSAMSLKVRL